MIFERIKELMVSTLDLDPSKIMLESYFKEDLGQESVDLIQLIVAAEEEYGMEVDESSLENMKQVKDVVAYFETH
jgi:acyl carrier protein